MSNYHPTLLAALLVGTALSLAPVAPRPATAQAAAQQFALSIPAQSLPQALSALSADTGVQVFYSSEAAYALRSNAVNGTYSTDQALAQMLAGTGATARRVGQNGITISVAGEAGATGAAAPAGAIVLDNVTITAGGGATEGSGSYSYGAVSMARGTTSLRDVPQSVTVITRQAVEDQNLTNMSDVMAKAPGIVANREANGNPNYYSRGFKINNYQLDSLGTSYDSSYRPDFDMALYDRVEILRGAEGLFSGTGEPGGSVNLARKRPTDSVQSSLGLSLGNWQNRRIEADISGPLAFDGALRGRMVGVWQDREFFYSPADEERRVLYGILEYDLTPSTVISLGASYQRQSGARWTGGLPTYFGGELLDFDRGIALSTDWSSDKRTVKEIFVEVEHQINPDWMLKFSAMRQEYDSEMFRPYIAGPVDRDTGAMADLWAGYVDNGNHSKAADLNFDGRFYLWGRSHRLLIGADWRESNAHEMSRHLSIDTSQRPTLGNIDGLVFPRPDIFGPSFLYPAYGSTQKGIYARLQLEASDSTRVILGGRYGSYEYESIFQSYLADGTPSSGSINGYRDSGIFTPYVAVIHDLTPDWSVYASLTDIYKSQANSMSGPPENPMPLDPITGRNFELGTKGTVMGGAMNGSAAIYRIERKGEAYADPSYPGETDPSGLSCCYLTQGKIISEGLDLELSGEVAQGWQVFAGYTWNRNRNTDGDAAFNALTPRHMLKLWTSYNLPGEHSKWTVGGGVTVKSAHGNSGRAWYADPNSGTGWHNYDIRQGGYAVWDANVHYRIDDKWELALNVNNVFDKRYYAAIGSPGSGNWYGEPRNAALTLRGRF